MNNHENGARWVHCPICGSNTRTKVYDDTVLIKFPLYGPRCKKEILVSQKITRHGMMALHLQNKFEKEELS